MVGSFTLYEENEQGTSEAPTENGRGEAESILHEPTNLNPLSLTATSSQEFTQMMYFVTPLLQKCRFVSIHVGACNKIQSTSLSSNPYKLFRDLVTHLTSKFKTNT